ncbi:nitroreductase/quinone reductase family protein [Streptomyces albus]|uniref:DUF385 domain-containing protein n=2 Tax=Streptomyces TaxID=1883 RepID=A0A8H1QTP4_9ACTN|nr:hypothetical protein HMPREF1486_00135 [Streptomyces sp. HPH0547]KPC96058.1 hypothetical protein ADL27_05375 [Streptomyces sp. NRRL F-6602]TGG87090.1 DUF385 domain-containing protein [Streptomyces albus]
MGSGRWRPSAGFFKAANRLVRPLLRSRLHPLLSGRLMLLTYEGTRTGRTYAIPVAYYRRDRQEVWAFGARTGWMSNFRTPRTVHLLLRGRELQAEARAVEDHDEVADLLEELIRCNGPRAVQDPFLGLPRNRPPTRDEALEAAARTRIARFRLPDAS